MCGSPRSMRVICNGTGVWNGVSAGGGGLGGSVNLGTANGTYSREGRGLVSGGGKD